MNGPDAEQRRRLETVARQAAARSYSPYSRFAVGAAVLTADGTMHAGCNVENASYGLTVCAERVAIWNAVAAGHRSLVALALYVPGEKVAPPCGACRQTLQEFGPEARVLALCDGEERLDTTLSALLPGPFALPGDREGSP